MIKCGIIGCGVIAPTHIESYQAIKDAEVIHLCDLVPERLNTLGDRYAIARRSVNYHELLADPDVQLVSVCTDHASHARIVTDALAAGKHVVCEKSLGRVPDDLEIMVAAARQHPELVTSGIFQHRFQPHNLALRDLVGSGKLGRMLMVNLSFSCLRTADYYRKDAWRGTMAGEGGGVLINQAIHHIDQLRFVFGEVKAVTAITANLTHQKVIEVEDTSVFLLEFENGMLGTVAATSSSPDTWRIALTITGDRAYIEYDDEAAVRIVAADEQLKTEISDRLSDAPAAIVTAGKSYYGGGHTDQLADVIDAIEHHRQPAVTLIDAANSSSLIFAVYESARTRRRVEVRRYR